MPAEFDYDPERALWKPGRRSFLFMFGAALVVPRLPTPTQSDFDGFTDVLRDIYSPVGVPGTMVYSKEPYQVTFGWSERQYLEAFYQINGYRPERFNV